MFIIGIKYCTKFVQISTRPGIKFNANGVCAPCTYFNTLKNISWAERTRQLKKHVNWTKKYRSDTGYDCIISVSGGKDSTRLAMYARDKLGLTPLLVSST